MKKIFELSILLVVILFVIVIYHISSNPNVNISYPSQIGIESIEKSVDSFTMNIFLINHEPISGIEIDIMPNDIIFVDSVVVNRNRLKKNHDFSVYNNSSGKILGFSMTGEQIPKSKDLRASENVLFSVSYKYLDMTPDSVWLTPILADKDGNVIECNSSSFQVGK